MRRSHLILLVALALCASALSGCGTVANTDECSALADVREGIPCMDKALFGRPHGESVASGAVVGGLGGAILGGAVAYAISRSPSAAGRGALAGTMVGGVAGGVIAYLNDKQARADGNRDRMIAAIYADVRAENRRVDALTDMIDRYSLEERNELSSIKASLDQLSQSSKDSAVKLDSIGKRLDALKILNTEISQIIPDLIEGYSVYRESSRRIGVDSDQLEDALSQKERVLSEKKEQIQEDRIAIEALTRELLKH